jgi:hypothetical protein
MHTYPTAPPFLFHRASKYLSPKLRLPVRPTSAYTVLSFDAAWELVSPACPSSSCARSCPPTVASTRTSTLQNACTNLCVYAHAQLWLMDLLHNQMRIFTNVRMYILLCTHLSVRTLACMGALVCVCTLA